MKRFHTAITITNPTLIKNAKPLLDVLHAHRWRTLKTTIKCNVERNEKLNITITSYCDTDKYVHCTPTQLSDVYPKLLDVLHLSMSYIAQNPASIDIKPHNRKPVFDPELHNQLLQQDHTAINKDYHDISWYAAEYLTDTSIDKDKLAQELGLRADDAASANIAMRNIHFCYSPQDGISYSNRYHTQHADTPE